MYIVTSQKRLKQITALVIVCLVTLGGFATYQYFQRYSAQPQALMARIQQVSTQSTELRATDVSAEELRDSVVAIVRRELIEQMSASNIPDPVTSAERLLHEATDFVENEKVLMHWLSAYLQQTVFPEGRTELFEETGSVRQIRSPSDCVTIARISGQWRLVSLTACETLDSV